MKHLIKKILREHDSWQASDDDKWNSLEKDLRYVVERLIERHKDSWDGDQYAVMGSYRTGTRRYVPESRTII